MIIAAVLIWVWPDAKIADPICTYLFSALVIMTTVPVFRDCIKVLMESEPNGIDSQAVRAEILELGEAQSVEDFHIWALAGNKNVMTVHVKVHSEDVEKLGAGVFEKVHSRIDQIARDHNICHMTAQIL